MSLKLHFETDNYSVFDNFGDKVGTSTIHEFITIEGKQYAIFTYSTESKNVLAAVIDNNIIIFTDDDSGFKYLSASKTPLKKPSLMPVKCISIQLGMVASIPTR